MKAKHWIWIGIGLATVAIAYTVWLMFIKQDAEDAEEFAGGGYGYRSRASRRRSPSRPRRVSSKRQIFVEPKDSLLSSSVVGGGIQPYIPQTDQCFCQPAGTSGVGQAYIGDCPCTSGDTLIERIKMDE